MTTRLAVRVTKAKWLADLRAILKMCELLIEVEPGGERAGKVVELAKRGLASVCLSRSIDLLEVLNDKRAASIEADVEIVAFLEWLEFDHKVVPADHRGPGWYAPISRSRLKELLDAWRARRS